MRLPRIDALDLRRPAVSRERQRPGSALWQAALGMGPLDSLLDVDEHAKRWLAESGGHRPLFTFPPAAGARVQSNQAAAAGAAAKEASRMVLSRMRLRRLHRIADDREHATARERNAARRVLHEHNLAVLALLDERAEAVQQVLRDFPEEPYQEPEDEPSPAVAAARNGGPR